MKKQVHVQKIRRISTNFSGTIDLACKGMENRLKWERDVTQQTNFTPSPDILLHNFDTEEFVRAPLVENHSLSSPMGFFGLDYVSIY